MVSLPRRALLAAAAAVAGCGTLPADDPGGAVRTPLLAPWRTLDGGYLGRPAPALGVPAAPGTGMFTRFVAPTALALSGQELLVADGGRLWRVDAFIGTMAGVPGVPAAPGIALALGPDGSAWVLDPVGRRLLRVARDGRLLQNLRTPIELVGPSGLALADGGATLLLTDGLAARWVEWRAGAGPVLAVPSLGRSGEPSGSVDGIAVWRDEVALLDRLGGAVHLARRDGERLATLGRGHLMQPVALGVDAWGRVWVLDAASPALCLLWRDGRVQRWSADALRMRQPTALAVDGRLLALADAAGARVHLWRIGPGEGG